VTDALLCSADARSLTYNNAVAEVIVTEKEAISSILNQSVNHMWCAAYGRVTKKLKAVRVRLCVSDSGYDSPYDSVHNLHTKGL
jgi:hypothetical protein